MFVSRLISARLAEIDYAALVDASPSPLPSFLSFLVSRYSVESAHAHFDRVRLKAILFLGTSSKYDVSGMKTDLEEMEMKGLRGLTLERAIVYGKVRATARSIAEAGAHLVLLAASPRPTSARPPPPRAARSYISRNLLSVCWRPPGTCRRSSGCFGARPPCRNLRNKTEEEQFGEERGRRGGEKEESRAIAGGHVLD